MALTTSITTIATAKVATVMHALPMNLGRQHLRAAAVEQSLQRSGVVGSNWPGRAVLAAGKQAERQRAPDAADAVDRNRADRIVDAQLFEQFNAEDDDHAGDAAEQDGARSG